MQNNRWVAVLLRCVAIQDIIQSNLEQNFAQQLIVFWLLTFKSQVLVNAWLASEADFGMHNPIALIILCSATNLAFAFSKRVCDKVVELFQDCACVGKSCHLIKPQFHFCGKTLLPLIYKALVRARRK